MQLNLRGCMKKNCNLKKTYIGGQAVMEGVMMRGKTCMSTSVRDSNGNILIKNEKLKETKSKISKIPVIRGVINFISTLIVGMKTLMASAEIYADTEEETSKKSINFIIAVSLVLGLALAIFLFIVLPEMTTKFIVSIANGNIPDWLYNVIAGLIKILIFIAYLLLVSLMKDIKRTFMYHGAEHKTINCYESGKELTIENVRGSSRLHNRCGTTFMFIVILISIFVSLFLPQQFGFNAVLDTVFRILIRIAFLPVVAGISYEVLKGLAKTDFWLFYPLKLPGLLMQKITTKEPDDSMIEVAICSFNAVLKMENTSFVSDKAFNIYYADFKYLFSSSKNKLSAKNISAVDAEWICAEVMNCPRGELSSIKYADKNQYEKINNLLDKRLQNEPLQYILGYVDFCGCKINVNPSCLIPRFETEYLADMLIKEGVLNKSVLDLCTGSGCIGIALAKHGGNVTACDISLNALKTAKENAIINDVDNFKTVESNLFEKINEKFDIIVSNPPYIPNNEYENLSPEVKKEPQIALKAGEDGLDYYRLIIPECKNYLNDGGFIIFECGYNQTEKISEMLKEQNFNEVTVIKDLDGRERFVKGVKN